MLSQSPVVNDRVLLAMLSGSELEWTSIRCGERFDSVEKSDGCVREIGLATIDEAEPAFDLEIIDLDPDERACGNFALYGEARDESNAVAHFDESLHGLDGGKFNPHLQRCAMTLERLDYFLALRRGHIVRDKIKRPKLPDGNRLLTGQCVPGFDDKCKLIAVDHHGFDLRVVRLEREDSDLDRVHQHLIRDATGERTLHGDFDKRMLAPELMQERQQIEAGVLVGREAEASAMQGAQLGERAGCLAPQIEEFAGVIKQDFPCCRDGSVARGAVKQRLA